MVNVKTAISIQKPLFDEIDTLARKMQVSRSHLFSVAVEEYLRRREARETIEKINKCYEDGPDEEEKERLIRYQKTHRRLIEEQW